MYSYTIYTIVISLTLNYIYYSWVYLSEVGMIDLVSFYFFFAFIFFSLFYFILFLVLFYFF